jgi:hypothetical protein
MSGGRPTRAAGPICAAGLLRAAGLVAAIAALPTAVVGQGNLEITLSTSNIAFPTPGFAHFDAGWIDHPGMTVSVRSRPPHATWALWVRADDLTLGGYGKPVSDIVWRREGGTIWTPLSGTDALVMEGAGDQSVTLYFRTALRWDTDLPDTYSAGLTFTAVRQ